ncbi:efflux RND transporter periplasmic adaptor subunit [Sphingobium boeckii]|uniref:HlyD family secretion protein n=1 Tax=Sphingobium boeckii TaxID=1082345 RepID=A0A7W9AH16_9SPHN|nr:HlyD family secretion protein [Sphingobium boeckii]
MRHYLIYLAMPALLAGCSKSDEGDQETARAASAPRAVSTAPVTLRSMSNELALSGILVSREEAAVASQLSGYPVSRVFVDQDDQVKAGQPLAQLDDTLLRADIAQQQAVLMQQRIAAEKARTEAGRVAGLENSGVLSAEAIAERRLAARTADATVAQAQAALRSLLVKQGLMTIRAPVAGRILSRAVRPGDIAAPGTIMFRIERDNLVEVDAEVPEQSINLVRAGQQAKVILPSGAEMSGTVRLVSAEIDAQTKLGRARVLMAPNRDLRPGGFATVRLSVSLRDALAVPESAVRNDASGSSVMALDKANRIRVTPVKTGARAGGWVVLASGPPAGTRVLTGGQGFVLDGDTVKPQVAR